MKHLLKIFLYLTALLCFDVLARAECITAFQKTKEPKFIEWTRDIQGGEEGYFSATFTGRVIKVVDNTITVEFFNPRGQLERTKIHEKDLSRIEANPLAKTQFELMENDSLKKIDSLNIPTTHKEQKLRKQGFKDELISGLDAAYYLKRLGQALAKLRINPFRTHISDLVQQIPLHFQHIRRGIEREQNEYTEHKLAILDALEKETQSKVDKESVTYAWWLNINERLSILSNPSSRNINPKTLKEENYEVSNEIIEILQLFPELIVLPTIHSQSPFSLNRFAFQGVAPVELANRTQIADGRKSSPSELLAHDFRHAIIGFGQKPKQPEMAAFHDQLMAEMESLKPQERQAAETVYWILTHESESNARIELSAFTNIESTRSLIIRNGEFNLRFANQYDLGSLLSRIDYRSRYAFKSIKKELNKMTQIFHRVAEKAHAEVQADSLINSN